MKILLLVDWRYKEPFFLENQLSKHNLDYRLLDIPNYSMKDRIHKIRIINLYFKYIQLAYRGVRNSKEDDVIICWNFTTSIAVGAICKLLFRKRRILALNIIAPERQGIFGWLRDSFFSMIMQSRNFAVTVNTYELRSRYSTQFKIPSKKFYELPDALQTTQTINPINIATPYVFCGGEAKRDWETLFKAASLLPQTSFICVAREKYFHRSLVVPLNVKMLFDIDKNDFNKLISEATIVALPLNSEVPAGLIILLQAALCFKAVIATDTPSIRNYIKDMESGLLVEMFNFESLAAKILLLSEDMELRKMFASKLNAHVLENYSPDQYGNRITNILHELNWI